MSKSIEKFKKILIENLNFKECLQLGGICNTQFDPYFLLTAVCSCLGVLWLFFFRNKLFELENLPSKEWKVFVNKIKLKTK